MKGDRRTDGERKNGCGGRNGGGGMEDSVKGGTEVEEGNSQ